ncbi:MAG: hypothetical protein KF831_02165 [Acidobacteria bacterium]|nr:hypothetical protein [Acidobacteriota bacterium]
MFVVHDDLGQANVDVPQKASVSDPVPVRVRPKDARNRPVFNDLSLS